MWYPFAQDGMRYRELLEGVYHGQDGTREGMSEVADLEAKLYTTYQYTNQSFTDYVDKYLSVVGSVRISGGFTGAYFPRVRPVHEVCWMQQCQHPRHTKQRDSSATITHRPPLPRVEQTEI